MFTLLVINARGPETAFNSWALLRMQTEGVINCTITENLLPANPVLLITPKARAACSLHYQCCPRKHPGLKSFHKLTLYKYCNKTMQKLI